MFTSLFPTGVLIGFTESKLEVEEGDNSTVVCVEVCQGVLKRDVVIYIDTEDDTAICE